MSSSSRALKPGKVTRRLRFAAVLVVAVAFITAACLSWPSAEVALPPGPSEPYAQEQASSDSVVRRVDDGGEVGTLTSGLQAAGFFCARVRGNETSNQTWCRAVEAPRRETGIAEMTTMDIVSTSEGSVEYVRINLPDTGGVVPDWNPDARLRDVLDASLFQLWPSDAASISDAIVDVRHQRVRGGVDDQHTPRRIAFDTERARYFVGEGAAFYDGAKASEREPLTFVAATDHLADSWPSSSEHSLTSAVDAAPALEAAGFDCSGEVEMPCTRLDGNQQVDYVTVAGSDEVVEASMFIPGGTAPDGSFRSLAEAGLPNGLPFLTDAVRPAVEARLDLVRHSGRSFIGIVEGALVIIEAAPSTVGVGPEWASPVRLRVGAPLVTGV